MTQRPRSSTRDTFQLGELPLPYAQPLLPTYAETNTSSPPPATSISAQLRSFFSLRSLQTRKRSRCAYLFLLMLLLGLWNHTALGTFRRDAIYLLRPIWDTPPTPFIVIPHFSPPILPDGSIDKAGWCGLHGWTPRQTAKPTIVDAILLSTEVDLLEIRMREYKDFVDVFVIVESDRTFAGTPKELHYAENRRRFEGLLTGTGGRIVYHSVEGLKEGLPVGSFENEYTMRMAVSDTLTNLRLAPGALVIQSDVDEILSKETLELLSTCNVPNNLHLNVKNYRYGFNYALKDEGYWRPHVAVTNGGSVGYSHGRVGDVLLENSGWHCTFCFATIGEMRAKMLGYSHNDRVRDRRIAEVDSIRGRVCEGREPFNMWPEAFTFKDLITQSDPVSPSNDFTNVPLALRQDPQRFAYLLDKGCERPN